MLKGILARSIRGRWHTALVCVAVLATTARGQAQDATADELARRHFDSGAAYLHESDYDNALKAFRKAHELSNRPAILLNIATVHERLGELESAIATLEQYLAEEPEGEHAGTVKLRLVNLKKRLESKAPEASAADQPVAASTPEAAPAQPTQPQPAATTTPPPAPVASDAPADEPGQNIPAYVLLGIGGLAAVAAGVTGYLAESEWQDAKDNCSPDCTDDDVRSGRNLAWTSTILTGGAVVSVGVGLALLLQGDGEAPSAAARNHVPDIQVAVGPKSAGANARWRF